MFEKQRNRSKIFKETLFSMKNFYKHLIELFFIFNEKIDNEENDSFEEDKILLFLLTFGVLQLY